MAKIAVIDDWINPRYIKSIERIEYIFLEEAVDCEKRYISESTHATLIAKMLETYATNYTVLNIVLALRMDEDQDIWKVRKALEICETQHVDIVSHKVVEAVNIEVKKGEKVAFIGENGSGKSTLIKMLLRFETPTKGKICIDGEDIQNYCLQQYRNLFAVVSQDVYLFHDTIRNNILMDREISDEELDRICRIWNLEEFIQESPEGYGRILEKNGGNISGGERQKMALLRAVIKDAEILILDEATANIDKEYDRFLQKRLLDDSEEKTVIVITHK